MRLVLKESDLARLKPETRADIVATLMCSAAQIHPTDATTTSAAPLAPNIDWENVVDLSVDEVALFMEGAGASTRAGLEIFAKLGPIVAADALNAAGITNYGHFQGRVTQRTRTIKKRKRVYLFGWDDWTVGENEERGFGHYGVTNQTWRSLRRYFQLS